MGEAAFQDVFAALRGVLAPYAPLLVCTRDEPDTYQLDTAHVMPNGGPLYFGGVQVRKRYVSYHLMPVYVEPALLEGASNALRARMQGKSCFNFRDVNETLFGELAALTEAGYRAYAEAGYVAPRA